MHCGPHVHGRIGVGDSMRMSVVGPAVNIASRLEATAKQADVQLAVSVTAARHGGLDIDGLAIETTPIRGSQHDIDVLLVPSARELVARLRHRSDLEAA
jgi:adenylate cyclase